MQTEAVDDRHQHAQLDRSERKRRPGRLIGQQPVPDLDVEEKAGCTHQRHELDRPPPMQRTREHAGAEQHRHQCRQPRLGPSPQRVRHALILPRNRWAA